MESQRPTTSYSTQILICKLAVFLILLFATQSLAEDFTVPKSWQVVAKARDGEITQFSIQGDWVAWLEKRLDPETAQCRAQAFFVGLYRKCLDSNEIETLRLPSYSYTSGEHFVLGDNGVVSYDYRGHYDQILYIPGQKPLSLVRNFDEIKNTANQTENRRRGGPFLGPGRPKGEVLEISAGIHRGYEGVASPARIYDDALLCYVCRGTGTGLSFVPFDGRKPELAEAITLVEPLDFQTISYQNDRLFWNGRHVLYKKRHNLVLFDTKVSREVWNMSKERFGLMEPVGLDDDYAYYAFVLGEDWIPEIYRRAIRNPEKMEGLMLPSYMAELIDFCAERLICIMRDKEDYCARFTASIDIKSGSLTRFDMPLPLAFKANRTLRWPERIYVQPAKQASASHKRLVITGDAQSGHLVVLFDNRVYLVPRTTSTRIPGFGWKPIKQHLADVYFNDDLMTKILQREPGQAMTNSWWFMRKFVDESEVEANQ